MTAKGGRPRATDPARSVSISLPQSVLSAVDAAPADRSPWIKAAILFALGVGPRPDAPPIDKFAHLRAPVERREVTPMFKKGVM